MKKMLLILFLGLPFLGFSQVDATFFFNKETKTIHLKLQNKYNKLVLLTPESDANPETGTYYDIKMKDANGKVIIKCSDYVFRRSRPVVADQYLRPLQSRNYKFDLNRWKNDSIHSIEIKLHVAASNIPEKIYYKNDLYKESLWK